jgi:tetratricopeptide (TPR) repeat protein
MRIDKMSLSSKAPLIGVYAICKNELSFVDRFYESIKNADSITICDTGSTDGTFERLQELASSRSGFTLKQIFVSPWRFDDARNAALSFVPPEVDLCISIDFDEMLQPDWKELLEAEIVDDFKRNGKVTDRYNHRFKTVWDWHAKGQNISTHWHERIHARNGFIWKLPVHEILVKSDGSPETTKWLGGWEMTQHPDTSKPRSSYYKMLELSVKEDPKRWKSWSFYAGELQAIGKFDEALAAYQQAYELPDADLGFLQMQIARLYQHQGNLKKAYSIMATAAFNYETRELAVYAAELANVNGNKSQTLLWIDIARARLNRSNGYSFDPACWDEAFEVRVKQLTE